MAPSPVIAQLEGRTFRVPLGCTARHSSRGSTPSQHPPPPHIHTHCCPSVVQPYVCHCLCQQLNNHGHSHDSLSASQAVSAVPAAGQVGRCHARNTWLHLIHLTCCWHNLHALSCSAGALGAHHRAPYVTITLNPASCLPRLPSPPSMLLFMHLLCAPCIPCSLHLLCRHPAPLPHTLSSPSLCCPPPHPPPQSHT